MRSCLVTFLILVFSYVVGETLINISTTPTSIISDVNSAVKTEVDLIDDEIHVWNSSNFPLPYSPQNQDLVIKGVSGFFVKVTIDSLDLDGLSGDFLVIKPGRSLDNDKEGRVFTYNLKTKREYLLYSNDVYISFQVFGSNKAGKRGFSLHYERIGEKAATTTEAPTTGVTLPTPSASDEIYYTVCIYATVDDIQNNPTALKFKNALAEMATEYCNYSNYSLQENITANNVRIHYAIRCPDTWPKSDHCVKVLFALPVLVAENSTLSGYQLTKPHLKAMWLQFGTKHLSHYGLAAYEEPNNSYTTIVWIVIGLAISLTFAILLYIMKRIVKYFSPANNGKRRMSDTDGIISNSTRTSKTSLAPHPYQTTPSFFDNDYSFDQFEPDVGIPKKTYNSPPVMDYHQYPLSDDDSDNDIVFSNFSNSRNNQDIIETNT